MAGAKLTSPGRQAAFWRTECHPKPFWEAYRDFSGWFKNVTGIDWDDRVDTQTYAPDKFRYITPRLGRPVGALPPGKKAPSCDGRDDNEDAGLIYDTDSEVGDESVDRDSC